MPHKVAIVATGQRGQEVLEDKNIREVSYELAKETLNQVGMKREELGTIIASSSDLWGGISCSHGFVYDALGGRMKDESKVEEDSAHAFIYGAMRVMSGHFDTALVHGVTKMTEIADVSTLTNLYGDPFIQRPIGLNDVIAAAIQARAYMDRYNITEEQVAKVMVKNLANAINNPYAYKKGKITVEEILKSEVIAHPLKLLDCAFPSDGMCTILLASEEKAKKLTDNPVWVKAMTWDVDHYFLADRDLLDVRLREVAKKAYDMAGISNPLEEIDVAEVCEPYSFQELLWYEQLGFCGDGEGGKLIDNGVTSMEGKLPANPSGGVLASNPYVARGLFRIVEAALQVMGKADKRQVPNARTALAHSTHGFAGQLHSVIILGK